MRDDAVGLLTVASADGLGPGYSGRAFTESIVERCVQHWPSKSAASGQARAARPQGSEAFRRLKRSFCDFFPVGWNSVRLIHVCPAGCCGPTACHSRDRSISRALQLIKAVVLKPIAQPAKNKWTKMDPAFCQALLMMTFFSLVQHALDGVQVGHVC